MWKRCQWEQNTKTIALKLYFCCCCCCCFSHRIRIAIQMKRVSERPDERERARDKKKTQPERERNKWWYVEPRLVYKHRANDLDEWFLLNHKHALWEDQQTKINRSAPKNQCWKRSYCCVCWFFFLWFSLAWPLKLITFYSHFQLRFVQSTKDLVGQSLFVGRNSFSLVKMKSLKNETTTNKNRTEQKKRSRI